MRKFRNFVISLACITIAMTNAVSNSMQASAYTAKGNEVVTFAESTEGVIEGRPNVCTDLYNAIGEWCAMWIQYCAHVMGVSDKLPYSSYCDEQYGFPGGVQFFKERDRFVPAQGTDFVPERSFVIYFDWDLDGYSDHVGYVRWSDGTYVYTIEANVSDRVQSRVYALTSPYILGYGIPDYEGTGDSWSAPDTGTTAPETPEYTTEVTMYIESSSIGAWVRSSAGMGNNKIGIVSTGTILYSDMVSGEWVHFNDIPIEGETAQYSGWIHKSTLTKGGSSNSTGSSTASGNNGNTAVSPGSTGTSAPSKVPVSENNRAGMTCYIQSSVGAWLRSAMNYSDSSKVLILDTAQAVDVFSDFGEWLYVGADVNGTYCYGYIHNSTLSGDTYIAETSYTYTIQSPIGANFRQDPQIDPTNILAVLDCGQSVNVLSISGEWAFASTDVYGYPMYGYIHTSCF